MIDKEIRVAVGPASVVGQLTIPSHPKGVVVFAHGSGSSRHSPRNRYVADVLNRAGLATVLFDLLTPEEEGDRANVFDIGLLTRRLIHVTAWLAAQPDTASLPVGYFGASTGAERRAGNGRSSRYQGRGGGVARRAARSGERITSQSGSSDPIDSRWARRDGSRAEPAGAGGDPSRV